ncbi:MAG: O-antigen ligase family protein [Clostridiales bacterium]|nr:O-antigen ligase family protein [Clostridiales bacterium]
MASFVITIILNYKYNLFGNAKSLCWFIVQIFVVGNIFMSIPKGNEKRYFGIFAKLIVVLVFVASAISLYYFMMQKEFRIVLNGIELKQGWHYNRLFGIYIEPNFAAWYALLAIILSVWLIENTDKKLGKAFLIINIGVQYIYFIASNSRGGLIASVAMVILFGLCTILRKKVTRKRLIVGVSLILVLACAVIPVRWLSQKVLAIVPAGVGYVYYLATGDDSKSKIPNIDRIEYEGTEVSTNRIPAWNDGLKTLFAINPIFGLGDRNIGLYVDEVCPQTDTIAHNGTMSSSFFKLLVSSGILGTLLLLAFGISYIVKVIKALRADYLKKDERNMLEITFIAVGTCFVSSLLLEDLFFLNSFSGVIFWGFIGIGLHTLNNTKTEDSK